MVNEAINIARVARGFVSEDIYNETTLYVGKGGNGTDGLTWDSAFTSMTTALAACSATHQNIIKVGAGTWDIATANYLTLNVKMHVIGSGVGVTIFRNSSSASDDDYIFNCTALVKFSDCTFTNVDNTAGGGGILFYGAAANNSVIENCSFIMTESNFWCNAIGVFSTDRLRIKDVYIKGNGTSYHTNGIYINSGMHDSLIENVHMDNVENGILFDHLSVLNNHIKDIHITDAVTGILIVDGDSNMFRDIFLQSCTTGIIITAGQYNTFAHIHFFKCTTTIDDEMSTNKYQKLHSEVPDSKINPADLTGTTVTAKAGANNYTDTAVTVLTSGDKPIKIVGISYEPAAAEKYGILLTDGTTDFFEHVVESAANTTRRIVDIMPFWISPNTTIGCKVKSETGGNNCLIWIRYIEV